MGPPTHFEVEVFARPRPVNRQHGAVKLRLDCSVAKRGLNKSARARKVGVLGACEVSHWERIAVEIPRYFNFWKGCTVRAG